MSWEAARASYPWQSTRLAPFNATRAFGRSTDKPARATDLPAVEPPGPLPTRRWLHSLNDKVIATLLL